MAITNRWKTYSTAANTIKEITCDHGFTLSECIITVAIVGTLSSIALPNYINQVNRTRQNEVAATISQLQTTIAAYADEYGILPTSWHDLNNISAVMTVDGPIPEPKGEETENLDNDTQSFDDDKIILANGYYEVGVANNINLFTITATREKSKLNVVACINLTNGASGINRGSFKAEATTPNCG